MKQTVLMLLALVLLFGCAPAAVGQSSGAPLPLPGQSVSAGEGAGQSETSTQSQPQAESQPAPATQADAFADIRAQIPYEGLHGPTVEFYDLQPDETAKRLSEYLSLLWLRDDFADVAKRDPDYNLMALTMATQSYGADAGSDEATIALLQPLAEAASQELGMQEGMFWLREHVEATARALYGPHYQMQHQSGVDYRWLPAQGVYTPPHRGGGGSIAAYLLHYEQTDTQYIGEIAVFSTGRGGLYDFDMQRDVPLDAVRDYAYNQSLRRSVVIDKGPDGALYIKSCIIPK